MRRLTGALCCVLLACGCASHKPPPPKTAVSEPVNSKPVVTPDRHLIGTVALVDTDGRFIIINFPPGPMPKQDDRLSIYHAGLKVADVKVDAKNQGDNNTVADIVAGEVHIGDEARQN